MEDERLCLASEVVEGQPGKCVTADVAKRLVTLFRREGRLFCIDARCFHQGGDLSKGDIEDLGGRMVLTCPSHKYQICMDTGRVFKRVYGTAELQLQEKAEQRTHDVYEKDGHIWLRAGACLPALPSCTPSEYASDKYNDLSNVQTLQPIAYTSPNKITAMFRQKRRQEINAAFTKRKIVYPVAAQGM
eukprot:jgi/Mesvir1/18652/Mv17154-RA.1